MASWLAALFSRGGVRSWPMALVKSMRRRTQVLTSGYFDADWYLLEYPDVRRAGMEPLHHFLKHGDREGRSPGLGFDSAAYLAQNPEAERSGVGPFEYFLNAGMAMGHRAPPFDSARAKKCRLRDAINRSGFFDAEWYLQEYPDVARTETDPLTHFAFFGLSEARDPGPNFSTMIFLLRGKELADFDDIALEVFLRAAAEGRDAVSAYSAWLEMFDALDVQDLSLISQDVSESSLPALKIVHVFDAMSCSFVDDILASYRAQIFEDWRAHIVFLEDVTNVQRDAVRAVAMQDPRVSLEAGLTNDAAADGDEFVLLLSGSLLLQPHALYLMLVRMVETGAQFVYTDHDSCDKNGRSSPVLKPEFSPELLRSSFYTGPCILVRTGSADSHIPLSAIVGDLRRQRCDSLVAALRRAQLANVAHVPFAAWTLLGDAKLRFERSKAAVAQAATPKVSIVIATRDRIDLLRDCIESIQRKTDYPSQQLEFVIVNNDSRTNEAKLYFADLRGRECFRILHDPHDFNFARLYNRGVRECSGEVVVLLNNDMTVIDAQWIRRLVVQCMQPDVACVGAKLLYPDETIQHAGCVVGVAGLAGHRLLGRPAESVDGKDFTREISAVTGACIAIRRSVFNELGGLNEGLRIAFNDIDFCLRAMRRGLRNVYIADPLLYHFESKSRGLDTTRDKIELNAREAIYVRQRHSDYFRNDPHYSPNLSLARIDGLAFPPRRDRPWLRRVGGRKKKILMLTSTMSIGHGVAVVVRMQALRLLHEGYEVIIAGHGSERDYPSEGWAREIVSDPTLAAILAIREKVDCVIAHTPPFYSAVRFLGSSPKFYLYDYGEPDPDLFDDRDARVAIDWEKRFCAPAATRVMAISQAIKDQSLHAGVEVLRIANSHMAAWSPEFLERRRQLRNELGWEDKFVVLNVCRFTRAERRYKGVDKYAELSKDFWFSCPKSQGKTIFALAGKAEPVDVAEMEARGLSVFPNVSDEFMAALYAASDMYVNFSKWEGYNLGIGQALAMGLPVIGSDLPAHREFPIFTTDSLRIAIERLQQHFEERSEDAAGRKAVVYPWEEATGKLLDLLRSDL